ncbi:DUF1622 domain-containing protein [Enterococcus sp. BWM-S5]|uniref:DUF1622 domain-containing protein n=1 Tax=Enterococcus larvae TaxID=2794352 RepID=A0ABS4CJR2_9ENTE|nr:DUF1622 domain-containing protein [Enterococcus larvae]MBP1046693.1 DUF1622 domain-containing protein [Enterococcus larvae]
MEHLAETILNGLIPVFDLFILCLNILSIIILLWGVVLAAYNFFKDSLSKEKKLETVRSNNLIKNLLGSYILLSLEILIAADIIESIIKPTFQDISKLAALVVIRTVISYFLHREIEDAARELEKNEENK